MKTTLVTNSEQQQPKKKTNNSNEKIYFRVDLFKRESNLNQFK